MGPLVLGASLTALFGAPAFADELPPSPPPIVRQYCSCVRGVKEKLPEAPLVDAKWYEDFKHTIPSVGGVVVFEYKNNVSHVAYIESLENEGFYVYEWNFHPCEKGRRFVYWNDPAIRSFWRP